MDNTESRTVGLSESDADNYMLVGIDGSAGASRALRWALSQQDLFGEIQPVTSYDYPTWATTKVISRDPKPEQLARREAEEALANVDGHKNFRPLLLSWSVAGPMLVKQGSTANLIVVGTRGRNAAAGIFLGSTSSYVVNHSKVPVAIVPPDASADRAIERVVLGVDGSENSIAALVWAIRNLPESVTLEVVHVWRYAFALQPELDTPETAHLKKSAEATLNESIDQAKSIAGATQHKLIGRLEFGDPRLILNNLAMEADLLVVGARGHRGISYLLMGSTTSGLIHQPQRATIVVPDPAP